MKQDFEIYIPPLRDDELEPLIAEKEQIYFMFGEVDDFDINLIYSVMGSMRMYLSIFLFEKFLRFLA